MVVQRLKTIAHVIAGQSPSSDDVKPLDEGIPFIQGNAEFGSLHPTPKWECNSATKFAEPGDILISVRAPVGEVNIADSKIGIGRGLAAIRPKDISLSKWLYFALMSNKEYLNSIATGSTFTAVTTNDIGNIRLTIPENPQDIADQLDRELAEIDEFIAECAQLSALTDERRLAAINNLIEPLLDNTAPIKHLGTLTSGLTLGATYNEPLESYPYLRVANVQAGMVDLRDIKEVAVSPSVALENMLQKDDVLMTEGGDRDKLGRGAIWSGEIAPMLHQNHVFSFRCNKEKLLPEFLVYCLEASYARRYFENNARQSTNLASTNSSIVKNFTVPLIEIDKQKEITLALDNQIKDNTISSNTSKKIKDLLEEEKFALVNFHIKSSAK